MHCCTTATEAAHLDRRKLLEKRICQRVALTETFARHPDEMPPLVCTTLCVSSPRKDWALPPARARVSSQTIQGEIATIRQLGFRFSVWSSTSVSLRLLCLVVAPLLICSLLFACALFRRSLEIRLLCGKQTAVWSL